MQRGQHGAAQERLSAALASQQQLGDVIGAARSAAALAELYRMTGQLTDVLALLENSITLNFEKGSPLGLAVNRRALSTLADTVAQAHGRPAAGDLRILQALVYIGAEMLVYIGPEMTGTPMAAYG